MLPLTLVLGLWAVLGVIFGTRAVPSSEVDVLEHLSSVPQGWQQAEAPPAALRLRFRIAVRQQNAYQFEQTVLDISTPGHPSYGQHLKRDELKAMLRPSAAASEAILGWLDAQGVPKADIEDDGDWINFSLSVSEAERILYTQFHYYTSLVSGVKTIRTLQYSVPRKLHRYIQMVQPTTRFGQMHGERSLVIEHHDAVKPVEKETDDGTNPGRLNAVFCNTTITPTCLKQLYNYGDFHPDATNGKLHSPLSVYGVLDGHFAYTFADNAQATSSVFAGI